MSLPSANSNNVTDRRAASPKRKSDVLDHDWPVVTKSVYQSIHRQAPEDMNPKLRQLCLLRVRLGQALMCCDTAGTGFREDKKLAHRLQVMRGKIEKLFAETPLEIK